ncbi:MAG: DUF3301 domain-containing protein [Lysobacteraceae bacterium]
MLLLVLLATGVWWYSNHNAYELARQLGAEVCARAAVQFLDHTVSLHRLRLRRDDDGRVRIYRIYRFDYSTDGLSRQSGQLALLGSRVLWVSEIAADRDPLT